jgi:hypothetical protein
MLKFQEFVFIFYVDFPEDEVLYEKFGLFCLGDVMFGNLNGSMIRIFAGVCFSVLAVNVWALEDETLAPTISAKNYVEPNAQYSEYNRDRIVRATGAKGGESHNEAWNAGISGYYVVNDRIDMRGSLYRTESHYTEDWLGSQTADKTTVDPLKVSASARYKLVSGERGGVVGQLSTQYGNSQDHGYNAEIQPYMNLSQKLASYFHFGYGNHKSGDDNQQTEYANAGLVWKPYSSLVLSPSVGVTHYESLGFFSSNNTYSAGLSARYDIDSRWSIAPSFTYIRYTEKSNNHYVYEFGKGEEVIFILAFADIWTKGRRAWCT